MVRGLISPIFQEEVLIKKKVIGMTYILVESLCAGQNIYVLIIPLWFRCGGCVSMIWDVTDVYKLYRTSKLFIMRLQTANVLFQHG